MAIPHASRVQLAGGSMSRPIEPPEMHTPPDDSESRVRAVRDQIEQPAEARTGGWLGRLPRFHARPRGIWLVMASLGPGIITANAGNDAGGIATYAQVGSTYGYGMLWMFPIILLSLGVVQEMAARMGAATGKGLSDLIRENFSIHATAFVLLALFIANGGTVISEFLGISVAVHLLFPQDWVKYTAVPVIAFGMWLLVMRGSYRSVERVFLVMTLVFFAYPISAVLAHPDWGAAVKATVVPSFHFNAGYLNLFIATIGTSITPYMQVYVQSAVADRGITPRDYAPERAEVYLGSVFANLIAAFIVVATAATLFVHKIPADSAEAAAQALGPIAGPYAKLLFAVGLFGASILAGSVLPLATAYSITEALGVEKGVSLSFRDAPVFSGIFTALIVAGVLMALLAGSNAIQVLVQIQVVNCVLLPIILFAILRLINTHGLMGDMVNGRIYNVIAYATAIIVSILSIILLITIVLGWFGINL